MTQASFITYRHSPWTFCRIFLHIVALTPGRCSLPSACLQSVIESVLLSNGSAHFGSESLLHSQHLIAVPENNLCFNVSTIFGFLTKCLMNLLTSTYYFVWIWLGLSVELLWEYNFYSALWWNRFFLIQNILFVMIVDRGVVKKYLLS